jgi:large subunit ribosomal protein L4
MGSEKQSGLSQKVLSQSGNEVGSIDLDPTIFDAPILEDIVHATVTWQRNKRRAGTHSTITKGVMKGGAKKPWRQKGTGRARAGSSTSPHWVGGAVAHGPLPRSYETRLSKRSRRQALCSVLTDKRQRGGLIVLEALAIDDGKTKSFAGVLSALGVSGEKGVLLAPKTNELVRQASRNIPGVTILPIEGVNVYDLVKSRYLLCTKDDVLQLQERLTKA